MSSLVSYEPYVDECSAIFLRRLSEFADSGVAVDMGHWFQCYAFEVIGKMTVGIRYMFWGSNPLADMTSSLKDSAFLIGVKICTVSWMH